MWAVVKINIKAPKLTGIIKVISHLVSKENAVPLGKLLISFGILPDY